MSRMNRAICAGLILIICAESAINVAGAQSRFHANSQARPQKIGVRRPQHRQQQKLGKSKRNRTNSSTAKRPPMRFGPQPQTNRPPLSAQSNGSGFGGNGFGGPGFSGSETYGGSGTYSSGSGVMAYDSGGPPQYRGMAPPALNNNPTALTAQSANPAANDFPPEWARDPEAGSNPSGPQNFNQANFNQANYNPGWSRVNRASNSLSQASSRLSQPSRGMPQQPGTVMRPVRPPIRQRPTEQQMLEMSRNRGYQRQ